MRTRAVFLQAILWGTLCSSTAFSFVIPIPFTTYGSHRLGRSSSNSISIRSSGDNGAVQEPSSKRPWMPNQKVAVAGATGRTGSWVVQELLNRQVAVVAMVRSIDKAQEIFVNVLNNPLLQIVTVDLTDAAQVSKATKGCGAAIWCATGFSDAKTTFVERFKRLLGLALIPQQSVDCVGVPLLAKTMMLAGKPININNNNNNAVGNGDDDTSKMLLPLPQVVMLSSAGVTRPSWDDEKKEKYRGSADIPIVRLNPFGILNVKAESEQALRQSGVKYCIVRPTGLNDKWPAGSRPLFSQGDVAVGRIHRQDVAKVLVDVLATPEACDKTFEVLALAGYPPARSIAPALERLVTDSHGMSEAQLEANFALLQQLLPGEVQDAAQLAMGQTYEELDQGKTGRLGERGTEDAQAVAPQPTSSTTTTV